MSGRDNYHQPSNGPQRGWGQDSRRGGPENYRPQQHSERDYDDRRRTSGGGRGGPPFGGRGSGAPMKHMGEHPGILGLLSSDQLGDRRCLDIIDPLITDRDDCIYGTDDHNPLSRSLPSLAPWRMDTPVGVNLTESARGSAPVHTVRSNFFRVAPVGIPDTIYHYNVSIFRYKLVDNLPSLGDDPEDLAQSSDKFLTTGVVRALLVALDEYWRSADQTFGVAYDGNSSLYSTRKMPLPLITGTSDVYPIGHLYQHDVIAGGRPIYSVVLRFVKDIHPPKAAWGGAVVPAGPAASMDSTREALQAMDVALLSFARKNLETGNWILSGNTVFSARHSKTYELTDQFVGMLGYHASFRACLSGLALVKDISVTCFLKGGNLLRFVAASLRCQEGDVSRQMRGGNRRVDDLVGLLKNCAVRLTHLKNMRKKFRGLGPAANDPHSSFSAGDEPPTTVSAYYATKYNLRLRHPDLPTVDVGTRQRPILIPMELVEIVPGQTRQRSITGDISAKIIGHAAMKPNDRFRALTQGSFLFPALQQDEDAQHFGVGNICGAEVTAGSASTAETAQTLPMRVAATLLPPAKLQFGAGKVLEPQLRGSWNMAGGTKVFDRPPAGPDRRPIPFGLLAVCGSENEFSTAAQTLEQLAGKLERESFNVGMSVARQGHLRVVLHHSRDLEDMVDVFKQQGARIVVVLLMQETFYPRVKFVADTRCLVTQCARFSVVTRGVRNYETSLLMKMNAKMGGTNHTLASRATKGLDEGAFQQPPKSISWVFDVPAMVIGIDVNHPDPHAGGSEEASVVAVVASMDGMLSQYCAHITACSASREPVSTLHESFVRLIQTFCQRNAGQFPRHIIVYRDGVADSQFAATLDSELVALQQAIEHFGKDEDFVKIAFVVCQKRHHTRFFYKSPASEEYFNPCVGLCVDARGFTNPATGGTSASATAAVGADPLGCIVGGDLVEFYLNSHAAVLGTSKPTRYVLLYDGIGFKLSELELLTFWLTHLYARCTRSVSIVAPAYYAHWAARRGRVLLTGYLGTINSAELKNISGRWLDGADASATSRAGMYFI